MDFDCDDGCTHPQSDDRPAAFSRNRQCLHPPRTEHGVLVAPFAEIMMDVQLPQQKMASISPQMLTTVQALPTHTAK